MRGSSCLSLKTERTCVNLSNHYACEKSSSSSQICPNSNSFLTTFVVSFFLIEKEEENISRVVNGSGVNMNMNERKEEEERG